MTTIAGAIPMDQQHDRSGHLDRIATPDADPMPHIPAARDQRTGDTVIGPISSRWGPVYVLCHGGAVLVQHRFMRAMPLSPGVAKCLNIARVFGWHARPWPMTRGSTPKLRKPGPLSAPSHPGT